MSLFRPGQTVELPLPGKVESMLRTIEQLERRVKTLEELQKIREGELPPFHIGVSWEDTRPFITLQNAIRSIIRHLGLELIPISEVPAHVEIQPKPAEDLNSGQ